MEVGDLEKQSVELTMEEHGGDHDKIEQTAEPNTNGEVTQDDIDELPQNHWQFSDEGRKGRKFTRLIGKKLKVFHTT